MIRLALSTLLASTAGTLLGWAVRLAAFLRPAPWLAAPVPEPEPVEPVEEPEPEPVEADEPDRVVIVRAEELPLRYALAMAADEIPGDVLPDGMQLAWIASGGLSLVGGPRPAFFNPLKLGRGKTWPVN